MISMAAFFRAFLRDIRRRDPARVVRNNLQPARNLILEPGSRTGRPIEFSRALYRTRISSIYAGYAALGASRHDLHLVCRRILNLDFVFCFKILVGRNYAPGCSRFGLYPKNMESEFSHSWARFYSLRHLPSQGSMVTVIVISFLFRSTVTL